jgi:hypothetical protein
VSSNKINRLQKKLMLIIKNVEFLDKLIYLMCVFHELGKVTVIIQSYTYMIADGIKNC